jgi:hypothetical protein
MYIVLFSGFRGIHRPPALPSHGIEDNAPDANDEADFDIPNTQNFFPRLKIHRILRSPMAQLVEIL